MSEEKHRIPIWTSWGLRGEETQDARDVGIHSFLYSVMFCPCREEKSHIHKTLRAVTEKTDGKGCKNVTVASTVCLHPQQWPRRTKENALTCPAFPQRGPSGPGSAALPASLWLSNPEHTFSRLLHSRAMWEFKTNTYVSLFLLHHGSQG